MVIRLKDLYFGKAEAEAENDPGSTVSLQDVFDDYLGVLEKIENDKRFIIVGRKGTGKSALARYYDFEEKEKASTFSCYIDSLSIDFHSLLQTGKNIKKKHSLDITPSSLFKWIILVSLAEQLLENEGIVNVKGAEDLKKFFQVNSGYTKLGNNLLEKSIESHKANVNIESFISFFRLAFGGEYTSEKHLKKAPFISLIPALERTVKYLIENEFCSGNKYRIVFDDLDELFKTSREDSENIASLVRTLKSYNTEYFNYPNVDVRILICIRPDHLKPLLYESGMSKTLESYAVKIEWYKHDHALDDEENVPLKRLINRRLAKSFERSGIKESSLELWDQLVDSRDYPDKSSFKEILKNTFYRPRDLINLLNTIQEKYPTRNLPIGKHLIEATMEDFSTKLGEEIVNELGMFMSRNVIDKTLAMLRDVDDEALYVDLKKSFQKQKIEGISLEGITEELYKYGVLGIRNNGELSFYTWGYDIDLSGQDLKVVKHYGLRNFLSKRRKSSKWW